MTGAWALLGSILAGLAVALVLLGLVGLVGRRVRLIRSFAFSLQLFAVAAGVRVALLLRPAGLSWLAVLLLWILLFAAVVLLIRLVGLFVFDWYLQVRQGVRLPPLLAGVILGAAYLIAALITLRVAYPRLDLGPLLAGGAVTSLVLGLALQPILGNFFAGLVISFERPYRINDWIRFGGTEAQVVAINWRTTHLRNRDNDNLVVPNGTLAGAEILNYVYPHPLHMERIRVGIHYRTPPHRVTEALQAAAARVEEVLEKPPPEVYLLDFADSAVTYELRIWLENVANLPGIASQVRMAVWEELHRRGIVIPFPIRTLEFDPAARTLELVRGVRAERGAPAEAARLFVSGGPDRGASLALAADVATVGRGPECTLVLSDPQVSKEHLRLSREDGGWVLTDLGSRHGTRVNGREVSRQTMRSLDRISLGETEVVFEER